MTDVLSKNSHAKINLWLRIHGRREDGLHEVSTRMLRLGLHEKVEVRLEMNADYVRMTCTEPSLPVDESNLAIMAVRAFQRRVSMGGGWHVHVEKTLPIGAGIGGGSGNAAAVLLAANELCGSPLNRAQLLEVAAGIGADVAFFVLDAAAADATGRGESVTAVTGDRMLSLVLIKPPFPIATAWAYQNWQQSRERPGILYAPQITPWGPMVNDLERPVFEKHLFLAALKMWLLQQPECLGALMSGSGSTLIACTRNGAEGAVLAGRAQSYCGPNSWVQVTSAGPF